MNDRLLTWPELAVIVPYCRVHITRMEREGRFPQRVQLGPNRVAWRSSEVDKWIDSRSRGVLPIIPNATRLPRDDPDAVRDRKRQQRGRLTRSRPHA